MLRLLRHFGPRSDRSEKCPQNLFYDEANTQKVKANDTSDVTGVGLSYNYQKTSNVTRSKLPGRRHSTRPTCGIKNSNAGRFKMPNISCFWISWRKKPIDESPRRKSIEVVFKRVSFILIALLVWHKINYHFCNMWGCLNKK